MLFYFAYLLNYLSMRYKVIVLRHNIPSQTVECEDYKEAKRALEDLKAAFPHAVKTGEISVIIEEI